jgi:hypothetical protein
MALDITLDPAMLAVVPKGALPTDTDWIAAEWVRDAPTVPLTSTNRLTTVYWYAKITATVNGESDSAWLRVLIGPTGTIALPDATSVNVYSKITDSPEVPVQLHPGAISVPAVAA